MSDIQTALSRPRSNWPFTIRGRCGVRSGHCGDRADTSDEKQWPLLDEFTRLVQETLPEMVTMENVTRIGKATVFTSFVSELGSGPLR